MNNTNDLNAYGNRQARLEVLRDGNEISHQEIERHLGHLHSPERKKRKNEEKRLLAEIEEKLQSKNWGAPEKLKYLLSLPSKTPFRKVDRRLLPNLFIRMRQSWFNSSH